MGVKEKKTRSVKLCWENHFEPNLTTIFFVAAVANGKLCIIFLS